MSAAAILATLMREALPGVPVLDLGLPAGRVFPWWPGARCGVADPAALPPAELALLRRFRQGPAGLPVFGLDRVADAALLAGAPRSLGAGAFGAGAPGPITAGASGSPSAAGPPLLVLHGAAPGDLTPLLEAGAMILQSGPTEGIAAPAGPVRGRLMLLGGSVSRVERWDLLLPADQVEPVFDRLQVAAHRLADILGGAGQWQVGGRVAMARLASLGMLATGTEQMPLLSLPAGAWLHDLPHLVEGAALPLGTARRLRLLLGALPARPAWLRLRLRGVDPEQPPALFLDGRLLPAQLRHDGAAQVLEAPVRLRPDRAAVLGLAVPDGASPGLVLLGLEFGA